MPARPKETDAQKKRKAEGKAKPDLLEEEDDYPKLKRTGSSW